MPIYSTYAKPLDQIRYTGGITLSIGDVGKLLVIDAGSSVNVLIPASGDVALPIGAEVAILQLGAGEVTITPDTGVTINSAGNLYTISAQYASVSLKQIELDRWVLVGALA